MEKDIMTTRNEVDVNEVETVESEIEKTEKNEFNYDRKIKVHINTILNTCPDIFQ